MENFHPNKTQREVLSALLDRYENSRTYEGENQIRQTFSVPPERILSDYDSDFADVEQIRLFESDLQELAELGLIDLKKKGTVIGRIILNPEMIPECYRLLNRAEKRSRIQEQIRFYESFQGEDPLLSRFCAEQIRLLETGHKPEYPLDEVREILPLCRFILGNRQELFERELSMVQFGSSKEFEKRFRSRVCRILRKYGDYEELLEGVDDKREQEQILLGEHGIYANPSYIYMKGDAELLFRGLPSVSLSLEMPTAFSSESLERLESIQIRDSRVMTIENLTSFNRMKEPDYFYLFLSGYHNTAKQRLLVKTAGENEKIRWFHFGDFDPDGFLIIEHLKKKTGIAFEPIHMGREELERYREFGRHLEENDRTKAKLLLERGRYAEEMEFMLREDCKIEQEIVSWTLENQRLSAADS